MKKLPIAQIVSILTTVSILLGLTGSDTGKASPQQPTLILPVVMRQFVNGYGTVEGVVKDASVDPESPSYDPSKSLYIEGAEVCFDNLCATTDENGHYRLEGVKSGPRYLTASAKDYNPVTMPVNVVTDGESTLNFALSPYLQIGNLFMRLVLTWDETPTWKNTNPNRPPEEPEAWDNDLNSYLWMNVPNPPTLVNFENWGDCTTFPNACLESEEYRGYGPETLAIRNLELATYYFGVVNHNQYRDGVPYMKDIRAQVQVYTADGVFQAFHSPTEGDGNLWLIFSMESDGEKAVITPLNCITDLPDIASGELPTCPAAGRMQKSVAEPVPLPLRVH